MESGLGKSEARSLDVSRGQAEFEGEESKLTAISLDFLSLGELRYRKQPGTMTAMLLSLYGMQRKALVGTIYAGTEKQKIRTQVRVLLLSKTSVTWGL